MKKDDVQFLIMSLLVLGELILILCSWKHDILCFWPWILTLCGVGLVVRYWLDNMQQEINNKLPDTRINTTTDPRRIYISFEDAEIELAPQLARIPDDYRGKLRKKRMIIDYITRNHGVNEYTNMYQRKYTRVYDQQTMDLFQQKENLDSWKSFTLSCIFVLLALLPCDIILHVAFWMYSALFYAVPFECYYVFTILMSVFASCILLWKRNYILSPIAVAIAAVTVIGVTHVGVTGLQQEALQMVSNAVIADSDTYVGMAMRGSMGLLSLTCICLLLYPWLKMKTILIWVGFGLLILCTVYMAVNVLGAMTTTDEYSNINFYDTVGFFDSMRFLVAAVLADCAVMLHMTLDNFIKFFIFLLSLSSVMYALPAFFNVWKGRKDTNTSQPWWMVGSCIIWLLANVLGGVFSYGFLSMSEVEGTILSRYSGMINAASAVMFLVSYLGSWILYSITQPKEHHDEWVCIS